MWSFLSSGGPRLIVISSEGFWVYPGQKPVDAITGSCRTTETESGTHCHDTYIYVPVHNALTFCVCLHWAAGTDMSVHTHSSYHFSSMPLALIITITPKHSCFAKPFYTNPAVYTFGTKTRKKDKMENTLKVHLPASLKFLFLLHECRLTTLWMIRVMWLSVSQSNALRFSLGEIFVFTVWLQTCFRDSFFLLLKMACSLHHHIVKGVSAKVSCLDNLELYRHKPVRNFYLIFSWIFCILSEASKFHCPAREGNHAPLAGSVFVFSRRLWK